jgi:hypothetical protein
MIIAVTYLSSSMLEELKSRIIAHTKNEVEIMQMIGKLDEENVKESK